MMLKKTMLLALAAAAFPGAAHTAWDWERVRSSDAPLAVIHASTGAYEADYTVGETCAASSAAYSGSYSLFSGYLSMIPSSLPGKGFLGFTSTSGVTMEGALWGARPADDIKLLFSTDISAALSQPGMVLTRVLDNTGQDINESWPFTMNYSGRKLVIIPSASWPKGSVFSVYYSSYIVDINGYALSDETTAYFSIIMDYQADNTAVVLTEKKAQVKVPADAYSGDFYLTLSTSAARAEIIDANSRLAALPGSPRFLKALNVRTYDEADNPAQPNLACVVTIPYRDDNNDGLVEGGAGRMKASSLAVWRLDEDRKLWVRQAGPSVNSASKQVSQSVTRFSDYALMGLSDTDLTTAYVFPVPFRPNAGDSTRYGNWTDLITFNNLPSYGRISIYTLSGELVRSLDIASQQVLSQVKWNVKNSAGETVASGVYIWEIVSGKNRKTGKLIVIK